VNGFLLTINPDFQIIDKSKNRGGESGRQVIIMLHLNAPTHFSNSIFQTRQCLVDAASGYDNRFDVVATISRKLTANTIGFIGAFGQPGFDQAVGFTRSRHQAENKQDSNGQEDQNGHYD